MINIKSNPFYILKVECDANRRDIAAAVEELEFLIGSEICAAAQNELTTPKKRVSAEMNWFPDLSSAFIGVIRSCIKNNEIIPVDSLSGISRLNAIQYNLSLYHFDTISHFKTIISQLNDQFDSIDPSILLNIINNLHQQAKIGEIAISDIERELNKKRNSIRTQLSNILEDCKDDIHVQIVSELAKESYESVAGKPNIIISDIIDQYEVWAKSKIDTYQSYIEANINRIKTQLENPNEISSAIDKLENNVIAWHGYTYPLELLINQNGVDKANILSTAYSLRNLCLYLHNEKGKTQIAYQLIQRLRKYLSNLDDISDKFLKDEEELSEIIKEADEYSEQERNNRQADKVYSVDISGDRFVIPPYCTCCLKPTSLTEDVRFAMSRDTFGGTATKTISVHMPICSECLEHRKQFTRKNVRICILCIIFGVLASFLTYWGFKADKSNALYTGAAVTTVLYFVITLATKVTPLSDSHSTRFRSADISAPLLDEKNRFVSIIPSVTFTFTNWQYANLFQKANGSKASPINSSKKINSAKKHSIYKLKKYVLSTLVGILFVSVILSLISININLGDEFSRSFDLRPLFGLKSKAVKMNESTVGIPEIVNYTDNPSFWDLVYADIISIEPSKGIYDSQDMTKRNNAVICEGKTNDGTSVWIYMTIDEYKNNIDDSAFLIYSSRASFKTIEYSPAARIYGRITDADLITPDLSTTISRNKLMEFKGIVLNDTEQIYGKANGGKALVPISVDNGEIFISPDYEGVCPFNIISKTKTDYYIYLEYQEPRYRTVDRRDQLLPDANAPYEEDIAFYLKAGQQVNLKIPPGIYEIYFATGDCFYGKQDLFGPETLFYVSTSHYYLKSEPQYFTGETITIENAWLSSTDASLIFKSQFPSR